MPEVSPSPTGPSPPGDSIILEEEIDPNYVPSQDEIDEYAKWLGMDLVQDKDLQWIAREGLKAPLPEHWKPCKTTDTDEIYYFNFSSGESTWDHPCDEYYRTLYEQQRKKKANDLKNSSCDLGVLRCLHAVDATRVHLTMKWVVSFSNLRPFGPSRATAMLRAGPQGGPSQAEG